ncbi:unnamed protein product [Owenia fusiformis]|uniref:Uncharacterized protein n=1 Tax=Owenia fusiformis TaxID=6347 RepID=A0A8S4PGG5_OWEFU|nr:unnamed protein product [Owenia fusiformis]
MSKKWRGNLAGYYLLMNQKRNLSYYYAICLIISFQELVTGNEGEISCHPDYDFWMLYNKKSEGSADKALSITSRLESQGLRGYLSGRDSPGKAPLHQIKLDDVLKPLTKCKYVHHCFV